MIADSKVKKLTKRMREWLTEMMANGSNKPQSGSSSANWHLELTDAQAHAVLAKLVLAKLDAEELRQWWLSLRLTDCGELVYRHAIYCPCGRTITPAYRAWRAQHPEAARAHDRRLAEICAAEKDEL
jgi:hypothetical protein